MLNFKLKFSFLIVMSLVVMACGGGGSDTIPVGGPLVTVEAVTTLESNMPGSLYEFGRSVAFSPDGLTLAVGEPSGDSLGTGYTVQLFNKIGKDWVAGPVIPGATFGQDLVFSPDGTALAVMNSGFTVHFYLKSNNSWDNEPTIGPTITIPAVGGIPSAIKFSPDGITFAISAGFLFSTNGVENPGVVRMYTKNNSWGSTPIAGAIIEAVLPSFKGGFGYSIAFSYPNGNTIAVGDPGTLKSPGKVLLFSKNLNTWGTIPTELTATVPAEFDLFGGSIEFSPDGTTLAVGQATGANSNPGEVQIFSRNGASWTVAPIREQLLTSKHTGGARFGDALAFNHDGTVLAVTEWYGSSSGSTRNGNVQLFTYSNLNWNRGVVLVAKSAGDLSFASVAFSAQQNGGTNSTIAVGQMRGNSSTVDNAGLVNIFETLDLP